MVCPGFVGFARGLLGACGAWVAALPSGTLDRAAMDTALHSDKSKSTTNKMPVKEPSAATGWRLLAHLTMLAVLQCRSECSRTHVRDLNFN